MKLFAHGVIVLLLSFSTVHARDLEELKARMRATTPDGAGPFPVVMMISGCSGFAITGGSYDEVQGELTNLGFLVIRVDSLEARGQERCDSGMVSNDDQVEDIQTMASYLRTQPNVKVDAINVLGWSWGGGGALSSAIDGKGVSAVIAYYPACRQVPDSAVQVPTLVLFGEADNVAKIDFCEGIFSSSKSLTLKKYPDAHHAFDNPKFDPPRDYRFGTLG